MLSTNKKSGFRHALELTGLAYVALQKSSAYEAGMQSQRQVAAAAKPPTQSDAGRVDPAFDGQVQGDASGGSVSVEPEEMTLDDVLEAEAGRPDLPDENADGLDEMDEEIRRQAEDLPAERSGRV